MMALYIPMHPSSKMPMMALSRPSARANRAPVSSAWAGSRNSGSGCTWLRSWGTASPASHWRNPLRKNSSVKSSLHSVLYATPALVSDAFRLSIPTSPGHSPLQFATVRIGPRCVERPGRMWCVYCHTASTTTSGASGRILRKTSIPRFWLSMKPWPFWGSQACPRRTSRPSRRMAFMTASSTRACAGQHIWLAARRRSPLAITITVSDMLSF